MIERQSRPFLRAVLVSTSMFALFAVIGCAVQGQNFLTDLDMRLANDLHEWAGPGPHDFLEGFNQVASPRVLAVLVLGLTLLLIVRGHYWLAATCVLAEVPGKILEWRLQAYFQRQRPPLEGFGPGWAFPSGGAMGSMICYGLLAYVLVMLLPWRRARLVAAGALTGLILLIGFSRLCLGWHYLTDVVAGYAAGAGCLVAARLVTLAGQALAPALGARLNALGLPCKCGFGAAPDIGMIPSMSATGSEGRNPSQRFPHPEVMSGE